MGAPPVTAADVPAAVAFVRPLLERAAEIRKVKPIIAYWCIFHAVGEVFSTKKHQTDPDVAEFARSLLTDAEEIQSNIKQSKNFCPGLSDEQARDILNDEDVAHAYVLNFASDVFDRADSNLREFKVTKSTAMGFIAAATFLDLERIWVSPLPAETADRVKYAKYQATRILKSIKSGEDPNEQYRLEAEQKALESALTSSDVPEKEVDADEYADLSAEPPLPLDTPSLPSTPADSREKDVQSPFEAALHDSFSAGATTGPPETTAVTDPQPQTSEARSSKLPSGLPSVLDTSPSVPPLPQKIRDYQARPPATGTPHSLSQPLQTQDIQQIVDESKAISEAKRHAHYATSALSFEDTRTAVVELTLALGILKKLDKK